MASRSRTARPSRLHAGVAVGLRDLGEQAAVEQGDGLAVELERGAVVVRSVVCPGGIVKAGDAVAGQIVASERIMRKSR